jgi:integrase
MSGVPAVHDKEVWKDMQEAINIARRAGCRLGECVGLTWHDVDWGGRTIWITGKGDKRAPIPMPPAVRELLWPLQGRHESKVFTYGVARNGADVRKGDRRPITYRGLETEIGRTLKRIRDFRFHDLRHTAATRVLRATGNLNVVRRMLRHENIRTTVKYAHSQHDDVLDAMQAAADAAMAQRVPTPSPHSDLPERAKADVS